MHKYIICAMHGEKFRSSARAAFNQLMRNVIRVVVLNKGKLFITGLAAWTTWWYHESSTVVNYWLMPVVLVAVGMYILASMFFDVLSTAVDTLFFCFIEDCEHNEGSPGNPYYISKRLMKLLRRP